MNLKTVFINSFILLLLLLVIELFLGKYFRRQSPVSEIPLLYYGKDFSWKLNGLYERDKEKGDLIRYKRDFDGFRSFSRNKNKKLVLTIGGSTTDQTFISEGETWQDYLDKLNSEYDFVNGGIDGQSSYGHLLSISNWHSKFLNTENVSIIIFYVGINDRGLINKEFTEWDFAQSNKSYIKHTLKDNSFFINKLLVNSTS